MAGLTGNARETATLSPLTKVFLDRQVAGELPPGFIYRKWNGVVYISALVKLSGLPNESAWRRMGVKTGTTAGDIRTVQIPVSEVRNFAHAEGLLYLQLDEPVHTTLDSTRRLTRADSVHEGLGGLTTPWHGDNVVVGIIDAGFDYRHPTLFDTTGTRYRVKRIWEQTGTGTPPAGYGYGHEITDTLDMWSKGYDLPISHGAHVSGIAAGSGYGSLNHRQYRGLADAADLVLVSITPPDTDWTTTGMASIIDGMSYIYAYAASVGKPAVVNLSWGCSIGPHDGLSLFSQACDNLTGPGRIFVLSAGNNGSSNIHVGKTFTATDSLLHTFPTFSTLLPEKRTWVDIWGDSAQTFCVQVSLYTGTSAADSTGYICPDNQLHVIPLVNATNDTLYVSISASPSEFNGKPRVFISLHNKAAEQVLVSVKGQSGAVNLWSGYVKDQTGYYADFVSNGKPWALAGNNSMTIGDLACTKSALTVGAYVSRTSYNHVNGGLVNVAFANAYGGLAGFTSRGPTADGRLKPDITAPGMVLGSAVNSYDPSFDGSGGGLWLRSLCVAEPSECQELPVCHADGHFYVLAGGGWYRGPAAAGGSCS